MGEKEEILIFFFDKMSFEVFITFMYSIYLCITFMCVYMCVVSWHVWRSQDNMWDLLPPCESF